MDIRQVLGGLVKAQDASQKPFISNSANEVNGLIFTL